MQGPRGPRKSLTGAGIVIIAIQVLPIFRVMPLRFWGMHGLRIYFSVSSRMHNGGFSPFGFQNHNFIRPLPQNMVVLEPKRAKTPIPPGPSQE